MKVASNKDGAGVWSAAFIFSLAFHGGVVGAMMMMDVAPPLKEDEAQVVQIEIMVIEQLGLETALPTGGDEPIEAELVEDSLGEPLEALDDTQPEDLAEDLAEEVLPEIEEAEALEPIAPPEPELLEAEAPEALEALEDPPTEVEPETVEEPVEVPEVIAEVEPEPEPEPEPVETELAEAPEVLEELAEVELAEPELDAPEPDVEDFTPELEDVQPDFAAIPDVAETPEDDFLASAASEGIGPAGGAPLLLAEPVAPPGPEEQLAELATPQLEDGTQVDVLSAEEVAPPVLLETPEILEEDPADEPDLPEDLVVAALPPELEVEVDVPPVAEPEPVAETPPTAEDTGTGETAEGVADGAPDARPADSEETRQLRLLVERIRLLSDRPCLVALPRRRAGGAVSVEILGADSAAMAKLQTDIFTDLAVDPAGSTRLVAPAQCAALNFVRDGADYPVMRLGIGLANDPVLADATRSEIEGIGRLQAAVIARPGWNVTLLMIDDEGVVQDLTEYLFASGDSQQIDVPVRRSGEARETRQLLLALASAGPLDALRATDGQLAEEAFAASASALEGVPMAVVTVDIR